MMQNVIDRFNRRMELLGPGDRERFLHGVYKQLVPSRKGKISNGEYRYVEVDSFSRQALLLTYAELAEGQNKGELQKQLKQAAKLEEQARHDFKSCVVDALHRYGFKNQAYRLVEECFDEVTAARTKHTFVQLDLTDPFWRDYAEIRIRPRRGGIQIVSNGGAHYPATADDYRTSIILDHGSEGCDFGLSGLYEICPVFGGKHLDELNLYDESAIRFIDLGKTLAIARAVRARDESMFKERVASVIQA
ncbi:MAG: hypothetical protein HYX24_02140 [Candidatus Aenigmarchaeota archaeon]|nr:hypothetical protein [Candidatus Aenigmarchaeota archaeon]